MWRPREEHARRAAMIRRIRERKQSANGALARAKLREARAATMEAETENFLRTVSEPAVRKVLSQMWAEVFAEYLKRVQQAILEEAQNTRRTVSARDDLMRECTVLRINIPAVSREFHIDRFDLAALRRCY